jgi:NitT/TauT family transport system ATP-binding protein
VGGPEARPVQVKIRVSRLAKSFELGGARLEALRDIDLDVAEAEFCCVVGPSGCGKTTLLRILAGLETQTSGGVEIAAGDRERPVNAMVFQEQSVFPWMTVEDNVGYGLRMRRVPAARVRSVTAELLAKVGLTGFAGAYPHQLSGGMKQRVAVARAFAVDPEVLLMDEPFAALDEQSKVILQGELLKIWEGTGKTVVFITHSIDEAVALADRVVVMTARPGRVKAEVRIDLPRPRVVHELKAQPEYGRIVAEVWALLKDEVMRSYGAA